MSHAPTNRTVRIVSHCESQAEFIAVFGRLCDRVGVFIASRAPEPRGAEFRFVITLTDSTPMLTGVGRVSESHLGTDNQWRRPGMHIDFVELDENSRGLVEFLDRATAKSMEAVNDPTPSAEPTNTLLPPPVRGSAPRMWEPPELPSADLAVGDYTKECSIFEETRHSLQAVDPSLPGSEWYSEVGSSDELDQPLGAPSQFNDQQDTPVDPQLVPTPLTEPSATPVAAEAQALEAELPANSTSADSEIGAAAVAAQSSTAIGERHATAVHPHDPGYTAPVRRRPPSRLGRIVAGCVGTLAIVGIVYWAMGQDQNESGSPAQGDRGLHTVRTAENENENEAENDTGPETETDTGPENENDTGPENENDTGPENENDTDTETETDAGPETDTETETETETETDTGPETDADTAAAATTEPSASTHSDQLCDVRLHAKPKAAEVFAAGSKLGKTPTKAQVPCATREFTFRRKRYADAVVNQPLTPKKTTRVTATMTRPRHTLRIVTRPSGATVYIKGKKRGKSPLSVQVPGFQKSSIKVSKSGYRSATKRIYLRKKKTTVRLRLKKRR